MTNNNAGPIHPVAIKAAYQWIRSTGVIDIVTRKGIMRADGYWWPNQDEERVCCRKLALDTKKSRYFMVSHLQTKTHIAHKYNISVKMLNRALPVARVMQALED